MRLRCKESSKYTCVVTQILHGKVAGSINTVCLTGPISLATAQKVLQPILLFSVSAAFQEPIAVQLGMPMTSVPSESSRATAGP